MSGGEKGRNSRAWGELQATLGLLKKWLKYCWFFSAVLSSAAKQGDLVIHIQTYIYICIFHIVFHCNLSQDIVYSSHCYTVILCCLSILYISFYLIIPNSQSSFPIPTCLMATTCLGPSYSSLSPTSSGADRTTWFLPKEGNETKKYAGSGYR